LRLATTLAAPWEREVALDNAGGGDSGTRQTSANDIRDGGGWSLSIHGIAAMDFDYADNTLAWPGLAGYR